MPASDPLLQYWSDMHAEQALYMEAWRQNVNSVSNPGGVPAVVVGPTTKEVQFGQYAPPQTVAFGGFDVPTLLGWQTDFQFLSMAIEGWRGEVPEYASFCNNFLKNQTVDRVDSAVTGCIYPLTADYIQVWSDYPTNVTYPADWDAGWSNNAAAYNNPAAFPYTPGYFPNPWTGCPAGLVLPPGSPAGSQAAVNSYVNINTCALAMATIIDPTGHAATIYAAIRAIEYAYSPPLDFAADPRYAIGPIGATG
jgi:hypothetical protein